MRVGWLTWALPLGYPVHALSFSPSGDQFLTVTGYPQPKLYDRDGRELGEFHKAGWWSAACRGPYPTHTCRHARGAGLYGRHLASRARCRLNGPHLASRARCRLNGAPPGVARQVPAQRCATWRRAPGDGSTERHLAPFVHRQRSNPQWSSAYLPGESSYSHVDSVRGSVLVLQTIVRAFT
jgi:hypothetical protein